MRLSTKFLTVMAVSVGMIASFMSFPATAVPVATVTGGAEIRCERYGAELDWNLVVGPDYLIGDNATVVLDGNRVQHEDLRYTDEANGTFDPVDETLNHTVVFNWYDSANQLLATDSVTVNATATCKIPKPVATVSCAGLVLGNLDGSASADFVVSVNGLTSYFTVAAHQSLTINTVKDGDFIVVKTPTWHDGYNTLINTTLRCGSTVPPQNSSIASVFPGSCSNGNTQVVLNNTASNVPVTYVVNGVGYTVAAGSSQTLTFAVALGSTQTFTVTVGGTVVAQGTTDRTRCQTVGAPFSYRVAVHMPRYRSGVFNLTLPAGTTESEVEVTIVRTCSRFIVNFFDGDGNLVDSLSARSIPGRSTLTVKANANSGAGWYVKKAAVAKTFGC